MENNQQNQTQAFVVSQPQQPQQLQQQSIANAAKKGGRSSYFDRQKAKNGGNDNWVDRVDIQRIQKDVPLIVKDFIFCNLKPSDVEYLCSKNINFAFRTEIVNKLRYYMFRLEEDKLYINAAQKSGSIISNANNRVLDNDQALFNIWKSMYDFLDNLTKASYQGYDVTVNYVINIFCPFMAANYKIFANIIC